MSDQYIEGPDFEEEDDQLGYNLDFDWETLPPDELQRHDEIVEMTREEVSALDVSTLNDLHLWAVAQVLAFDDETDEETELPPLDAAAEAIFIRLIDSRNGHPALDYGAIGISLVEEYMSQRRFDKAREVLPRVARHTPDDSHIEERFEAMFLIMEGSEDDGFARLDALAEKAEEEGDGYLVYGLARDLLSVGCIEECEGMLESAEQIAREQNDQELIELVEEARGYVQELYEEGEDEEA
jgi:hypothetical protein